MVALCWKLLLGLGALISHSNASLLLPNPTGGYHTSLNTLKLVDDTRLDPFSLNPERRAVMVSAFSPIMTCTLSSVSAFPNGTADYQDQNYNEQFGIPLGTFQKFAIRVCSPVRTIESKERTTRIQPPLLLFSGALGTSRLLYNAIAQSIASHGYHVVTVDHPYDAYIVEYPDGSTVLQGNISTDAQVELSLRTRSQDLSFVVDQLGNASIATQLLGGRPSALDVRNVGVFGHSLGGATAGSVMLNDPRFVAGINFDGTMFGPVVQQGLNRPFILFGHENKTRTADYSWEATWPKITGWKREFELKGSVHYTFSDVPILADLLGLRGNSSEVLEPVIGTIDPMRALDIATDYTTSFFDKFLRGINSGDNLLDGISCRYPEVSGVP